MILSAVAATYLAFVKVGALDTANLYISNFCQGAIKAPAHTLLQGLLQQGGNIYFSWPSFRGLYSGSQLRR